MSTTGVDVSSDGKDAGTRRNADLEVEPEDARRGLIAALPADRDEAVADRAMADAERAVVAGNADDDQRARVAHISGARTHEERRRLWSSYQG